MTASELPQTAPESPQPGWDEAQIGRYQFRRLVGAGGMGVVVAAHDPDLQRDVAIKLVVTGDDDRPRDAPCERFRTGDAAGHSPRVPRTSARASMIIWFSRRPREAMRRNSPSRPILSLHVRT